MLTEIKEPKSSQLNAYRIRRNVQIAITVPRINASRRFRRLIRCTKLTVFILRNEIFVKLEEIVEIHSSSINNFKL